MTDLSAPARSTSQTAAGPYVRIHGDCAYGDNGYPSPYAFGSDGPGGIGKVMLLFDTLVWKDERGITPWLALDWEADPDGLAWRFRLRSDARFHDGPAVTAEDVAFSYEYATRHGFRWAARGIVAGAEAIDSDAVRIRLARPYAPFLENVAGLVPIVPARHWANVSEPATWRGPEAVIGSGPFELAHYFATARIEREGQYAFRPCNDHFGATPRIAELSYVSVASELIPAAVERGAANVFLMTEYDAAATFPDTFRLFKTGWLSTVRLIFNVDRPPLDDRRVRFAIGNALDRRAIGEEATQAPDLELGSLGIIPPDSRWFAPGLPNIEHDPSQAARILDEAGLVDRDGDGWRELPDGTPLTLELLAPSLLVDARRVTEQLAAVGLRAEVSGGSPATRLGRLRARDFSMAVSSHPGAGGDPDFLRRWYTGEAWNDYEAGNAVNSPEVLALCEAQASAIDPVERLAIVQRLQAALAAELPTLPIYYRRFLYVYDPSIWDRWSMPAGGLLNGQPLIENKAVFFE